VIAWTAKADNLVESEYILMEEAPGVQLGVAWDTMELAEKVKVVEGVVALEHKLLSVSFSRFVFPLSFEGTV
jgi:hypothetical protein